MSDVYSFRAGPTYRGASRQEMFDAAMEQPLSITSTLLDQAKGGVLESFGLGTVIRDATLPEAAPVAPGITTDQGDRDFLHGRWETPDELGARRQSMGALDENQYKASPYFRENIPYDPGMTETRAAALASADDARTVRQHYASKRPISAFIGNLGGQALDPINYVPIAGPAVKAAAVSRAGRFAGEVLTASADAAANTAIFGIGTASERAKFGDDVSWQSTVSQIATAALIGSAFGAISGAIGKRVDARSMSEAELRLGTLKTTQEARIALNEGIDAMARGEDIRLSPNSTEPLARVAGEIDGLSRAYDAIRDEPTGPAREPLIAILPEDIEGTLVARGAFKDVNELEFSKRGWGLVKVIWGHGDKSAEPPEFQVSKGDITDLPNVIRKYEPSSVSPDGLRREWRVERDGRTVVYADSMMGERGRHLVTTYIPRTPDELTMPLSKERPAALPGSRPQAGNLVGDTVGDRSIGTSEAGQSMPARGNIAQRPVIDNTVARPEPAPEGIKQAEAATAKPDDAKALAAQYRVDPQTGSFAEEAEVAQLAAEGRLTPEDASTMAQAQSDFETGDAYAEALKSVASCLL